PRSGDIKHSRASNQRLLGHFTLDEPTPLVRGLELLMGQ
ncbi:NAD-dependent epimerase/dehydratase, partial [Pseudomonas syringae pv. japonica str. M301072]